MRLINHFILAFLFISCGRPPIPAAPPVREEPPAPTPISDSQGIADAELLADTIGNDVVNHAWQENCEVALRFEPTADLSSIIERLTLQRAANGRLTVALYGQIPMDGRPHLRLSGPAPCAVPAAEFDVWATEMAAFERCDTSKGGDYSLELTFDSPKPLAISQGFHLESCVPELEDAAPAQTLQRIREQMRTHMASIQPSSNTRQLSLRIDVRGGPQPEEWCLTLGQNTLACDNRTVDAVLRIAALDLVALHEGRADSTKLFLTGRLQLYGDEQAFAILTNALAPE